MNDSILITGANVGLGKETARQLALKEETRNGSFFSAEIKRKQRRHRRISRRKRGRGSLTSLSAMSLTKLLSERP